MNLKNNEISDELDENSSGWQIYPSTKSPGESFERISGKVDFNVVRDPNIPLGLLNYGENVCFFNSVIQILYCLPLFRDYINKLRPPVKGVAMKTRKLFRVIETSNEPVRTNLGCNMMLMSASCSYLQKFTPILMMTACLRLIN